MPSDCAKSGQKKLCYTIVLPINEAVPDAISQIRQELPPQTVQTLGRSGGNSKIIPCTEETLVYPRGGAKRHITVRFAGDAVIIHSAEPALRQHRQIRDTNS